MIWVRKRCFVKLKTSKLDDLLYRHFPTIINSIQTQGDRIVVSDAQESVHFAVFHRSENKIMVFADDTIPRHMTCFTMVDYDTVVGGDKYGQLFVNRLPKEISEDIDSDPTGNKLLYERAYLQGAPFRVSHECEFFVGEAITSLSNAQVMIVIMVDGSWRSSDFSVYDIDGYHWNVDSFYNKR